MATAKKSSNNAMGSWQRLDEESSNRCHLPIALFKLFFAVASAK